MPMPNPTCPEALRLMSKLSGLVHRRGSRLAAPRNSSTFSPAGMRLPATSTSRVVVRKNVCTGDSQRLSLVGFSSSRLLSHMNLGLGVLLFGNRGPRWPRFRHEATYYQSITSDQQADNRDDATRKTTQHAWARTLRGGATSHMRLG